MNKSNIDKSIAKGAEFIDNKMAEKSSEIITKDIIQDQTTGNIKDEIFRLGKLHPIEYEQVREQEANKLGVRVGVLDKEVTKSRNPNKDDDDFPVIEPYPRPIDAARLLDEISITIRRFIVLDKYQADIAALWIAACWFIHQILVAPIALINAPEKNCGKTQFMTVLSKLALRQVQLSGISPSVLFRLIEKYQPTMFIDEIETVLKDNEDLRGLLNAGHTRDSAFVWRNVPAGNDFEPKKFKVWGMKAIAGINAITLAETVTSRSIIFELRRKKRDENVDRLRHAEPDLFETLRAKLARFSVDYSEHVKLARPHLPNELGDREQDNIEPLLQIAHVAGGHWPDTALKAALKIYKTTQSNQGLAIELLSDIQEIFETKGIPKISTADLITALISDDEKSWQTYNRGKQLNPKQLANKLKPYGIFSKTLRIGFATIKGYELDQFEDAFERYLPQYPAFNPLHSNISLADNNDGDFDVSDNVSHENAKRNKVTNVTHSENVTVTQNQKETLKPLPAFDGDAVTDRASFKGEGIRI